MDKHAWYKLTRNEQDELTERISFGEIEADEANEIDHFNLTLSTGRIVNGFYRWADSDPTDWYMVLS